MNCMKCGRDIVEDAVFCPDCLADMERYPVKPGTVVLLPTRAPAPAAKKPVKRALPPEEQVRLLNKRIRRLRGALVLAIVLALAATTLALYSLQDEEIVSLLPGQNYSASPKPSIPDPT